MLSNWTNGGGKFLFVGGHDPVGDGYEEYSSEEADQALFRHAPGETLAYDEQHHFKNSHTRQEKKHPHSLTLYQSRA